MLAACDFVIAADDARATLGLPRGVPLLGCAARLHPLLVERNIERPCVVGHSLGEFAPTRTYYGHGADKKVKRK